MSKLHTLFAKQPIFDAALNVAAYELLFREPSHLQNEPVTGDHATSHVLLHAFGQQPEQSITGSPPVFINFTRNLLLFPPPLPPQQLVVEVLENIYPDKQVLEGLQSLKQQGYKIALDDFFLSEHSEPLLAYADIVKVDVLATTGDSLSELLQRLKPLGVTLLAEKIETQEMFNECKVLGFELFQGYFLSRPLPVTGLEPAISIEPLKPLLNVLCADHVEPQALSEALATDMLLSSRLLRVLNSRTLYSRDDHNIASVNEALQHLGPEQVQAIALPLLLASSSGKPAKLCMVGLTRARFCTRIGETFDIADGPTCFKVGALSAFDALVDTPLKELVDELDLPRDIIRGLVDPACTTGAILCLCKAFETANWRQTEQVLKHPSLQELPPPLLTDIYANALSWAREVYSKL